MANLTKIGAVIELQGAQAYLSSMKAINIATKDLKSQMDVLTSSFSSVGKTTQQLKEQKSLLAKQIETTKNKLAEQNKLLEEGTKYIEKQGFADEKQAQALRQLRTDVDKTTIEFNELLQKQKELAQDNSITLWAEAWKNATSKTGEALVSVGKTLTKYVTAPIVAGATASVKVAADYQSAFTGVKKTVEELYDANGNLIYSYEDLNAALKQIPLDTASSYETVAAVAEALGQLGVQADKIPNVAKNIIMLGDSTNISAEEAATSIAQFMNIMGKDVDEEIQSFGNALVGLGNNFATDEQSILRLSTRLASAGRIVGLSTPQVLGLATAMSQVGLTAEAGGTAMSTTMKMMAKDVAEGGEALKLYGEVTGQTAEEFAETWRNEPIKALQDFLIGMANLDGGSAELLNLLDDLGFAGIRQSDTLQRLTLDYQGLTDAVALAEKEYDDGTALTDEATKRYQDFNSQVSQLKEAFKQLLEVVGADFLPKLTELVIGLKDIIVSFKEMDPETRKLIESILGIVAAIGPLLAIGGKLLIFIAKVKSAGEVVGITAGAFGNISKVFGGVGLVITGSITAIQSFVNMLKNGWSIVGEIIKDLGIALAAIGAVILGAPALVTGIIAAIVAAITSLVVIIKEHWNEIVEFVKNIFNTLKDAWNTFKSFVSELFNTIVEWVSNKARELKNSIITEFNEAKNNAINIFNNLKETSINTFTNLKSGISNKVSEIKNTIVNGLQNAWNYIKSIPSQAWSWGKDIIGSLANGITSAIGNITGAVRNVAETIWSYLHFSEPEIGPLSNFHTFMPDMIDMMVKGIDTNMYKVDNAINDLASSMVGGFENQSPNYNYGGVVINLNVPQGADGRVIVDQIEDELAARTIRRRAVFN